MARALLLCSLGLLTACATTGQRAVETASVDEWAQWPDGANPVADTGGETAAALALPLVGLRSIAMAGAAAKGLPDDCTGVVRYAWQQLGVDLFDGYTLPAENGVSAMHRAALAHGAFHAGAPQPGDLVFFRETYDRNRDGKQNDGLTHVGIVESALRDGTVTFIHRISKGIVRGVLNLKAPLLFMAHGAVVNDYLRPASKRAPPALTGELLVGFSTPIKARQTFAGRR